MPLSIRCLTGLIALASLLPNVQSFGQVQLGVTHLTDQISPGYVLVAPLSTEKVYLLDTEGRIVHSWQTDCRPGQSCYLLEDGSLLRGGKTENSYQFPERAGSGGRIQKYTWDGELVWDFPAAGPTFMSHHDIEPLPNGNVLCIIWDSYYSEFAESRGRRPELLQDDVLWMEAIIELRPKGLHEADIVWRWDLKDHLIQDTDPQLPNYGDPEKHPQRIDINYIQRPVADWVHMNSIDYHPELDQILVSSRAFSECWIIDHGTTTEEAAGSSGGRAGQGGDLLYRWGNPEPIPDRSGRPRTLFHQHDAHWIEAGLPGAGNVLLFNNGADGTDHYYSSVDEYRLPVQPDGTYKRNAETGQFASPQLVWTFFEKGELYSPRISGAQRQPNGNTLICSGTQRLLLEVTAEKELAWIYRNPPRPEHKRPRGNTSPPLPDMLPAPGGIPLDDGGTMFRARKYSPDHPAFEDRVLHARQPAAM